MTLSEFNVLDEEQQATAIWSGTRVATRRDEEHEIVLYQIDGLFVEVFFNMTYDVIIKFEAIGDLNQLLIYLKPYEARHNRIVKDV
jgi:hypothetical protein